MKLIILDVNYDYLIIIDFYAKHLQALKDAGIMTNISDPNATEMRGWVMLMLERAAETVNPSECNDPAVLLACSLGSDSCPAACRDNTDETTVDENGNKVVVKSGDLSISATAAEGKKALLNGGTSDLDTITIKVSEAITINSITLERYGFSSYKDVANIWLENANGVKIANEKSISSSKDTVTLNLKKEYRTFNNDDTITIVVETNKFVEDGYGNAEKAGTSIGFKVTAVDSTAKNLDISNYSPYLYDMIVYTGSEVTVAAKGKATKYHYDGDKSYEVARFQVRASNTAMKVDGFTLTNVAPDEANSKLDLDKYLDKVIVSLNDGTELKNVRYEANKDDELKVSFDEVEIAINKSTIFVVEVTLKDLDKFGNSILFQFAKSSDLNVKEQKNDVRATVSFGLDADNKPKKTLNLYEYTFQGGKIEVSNTKLAENIDAAAGASDIVVGEGKITIPESIKLADFTINVASTISPLKAIESFKMVINNEEFEASKGEYADGKVPYTFSNVTIDESGIVKFVIDLKDHTATNLINGKTLTINDSFDKTRLSAADANKLGRYEDSRQDIAPVDWAGSISLSNVRIQAARGSLTNTAKDVEFLSKQAARKVVFDGTYTAQKQDVYLNEFAVRLDGTNQPAATDEITFYLSIDGKEVSSWENKTTQVENNDTFNGESFSNILIKKGEKVSVKVEANVNAAYREAVAAHCSDDETVQNECNDPLTWIPAVYASTYSPIVLVKGEDKDGNKAGFASETAGKIKVVAAGSVTISESGVNPKESVEVNEANVTLARFTVKSSKNTEGMTLNEFMLTSKADAASTEGNPKNDKDLTVKDIRVKVDGKELIAKTSDDQEAFDFYLDGDKNIIVEGLSEDIPSAGLDVEVILKSEKGAGLYKYELSKVNSSEPGTKFAKMVLPSVASIKSQENRGNSTTKFTFAVDKDSNNAPVKNVVLYTKLANGAYEALNADPLSTVEEGTTLEITNGTTVRFVDAIAWGVASEYDADSKKIIQTEGATAPTVVYKSDFRDFFKVGDAEAQVFRTSN